MMQRFLDWLSEEANVKQAVGYIIFGALIVMSLDYAVEAALENWGLVPRAPLPKEGDTPFKYYNALVFMSIFVWAPVKEEVMFRVLPLAFVIAFVSKRPGVVFGIASLFAAIFGAIHPYGLAGRVEVAISGFFFGLVFLKCGGMKMRFVKASVCAMATHSLTNVFVVLDAWYTYLELTMK